MKRPLHPWPTRTVALVLAVLFLPSPAPLAAQVAVPDELAGAADAAAAWLGFLDEGEFDQAWTAASSALQVSMSPQLLEASVEPGRRDLGNVVDHTLLDFRVVTDPPNAAPGDYAVFQYRTLDEEGRTLVESVVLRPEGDEWLVAGYFTVRE